MSQSYSQNTRYERKPNWRDIQDIPGGREREKWRQGREGEGESQRERVGETVKEEE